VGGLIPDRDLTSFFFLHNVHTGSGAHPTSCTTGTGGASPEVRQLGSEADHSPPSNAKVKNKESIPSLPHVFTA
jgi:hypothetical protein